MITDVLKAGLSGAVSGGALGLGTSLLQGAKLKQALRNAAMTALGGGAIAGGGIGIGAGIYGEPDADEVSPYTKRGATGGGIAGAAGGGLLGEALAAGRLGVPKRFPGAAALQGKSRLIAAMLGAGVGGVGGSYMGADEGMQLDFLQNEMREMRKRQAAKNV